MELADYLIREEATDKAYDAYTAYKTDEYTEAYNAYEKEFKMHIQRQQNLPQKARLDTRKAKGWSDLAEGYADEAMITKKLQKNHTNLPQ